MRRKWRCFYCDAVFTNPRDAREHFGEDLLAQAGCQLKGHEDGLLGLIRKQERELARYRNEDQDVLRLMHAMQSDHAMALHLAEETGYGRGVRDLKAIAEKQFGAEVVV